MTDSQELRQRIAQVDGGELTDMSSRSPYSVVFPPTKCRVFVYTTKTHAATQLLADEKDELPVGLIGHYGLPRDEDLAPIGNIVRDSAIYFLGDCDPFDLLVFAWLRRHLSIRFLGTSDAVVSALGVNVNERITIPFPVEEQRAMSLVREIWPDFSTSVGPTCARLLDGSHKLELEALVSFHTSPVCDLLILVQETA